MWLEMDLISFDDKNNVVFVLKKYIYEKKWRKNVYKKRIPLVACHWREASSAKRPTQGRRHFMRPIMLLTVEIYMTSQGLIKITFESRCQGGWQRARAELFAPRFYFILGEKSSALLLFFYYAFFIMFRIVSRFTTREHPFCLGFELFIIRGRLLNVYRALSRESFLLRNRH